MVDLLHARDAQRPLALLAQAELEHYRSGLMRLLLLFAGVLSALVLAALPLRGLPSTFAVAAGAIGASGSCLAALAASWNGSDSYWRLGRHPWQIAIAAIMLSVLIAIEGVGSSLLYFSALPLIILPIAVGRPGWSWITAALLILLPNLLGGLLHADGLPIRFVPSSNLAITDDVGMIALVWVFGQLIERQARHVPAAFIQMILTAAAPEPVASIQHYPELPIVRVAHRAPTNLQPIAPRIAAEDKQHDNGIGALPAPAVDAAALVRSELGLSSRELEVMLLLLGGVEEAEIGLRLAYLSPHAAGPSRSTVNKHIESARRKIANAASLPTVSTAQAAALTQLALDRQAVARTQLPSPSQ